MKNINEVTRLFEIVCVKFDGAPIGKKVVQKLFYFFERKGIQLNLRYGIHFYGPYSAKLDNIMHILESEDYISINTDGHTHIVSMGKRVKDCSLLSDQEKCYAEFVMEHFGHKSSLELEALATMDYVANYINRCGDKKETVASFKKIKGNKFNDDMIEEAYDLLKQLCFIKI